MQERNPEDFLLRYRGQFKKTRPCRYYAAMGCAKGSACAFAHGLNELQVVPDLKKTAMCKLWKRRACPLPAGSCQFAHGKHDLRSTPAFMEVGDLRGGSGLDSFSAEGGADGGQAPGEQAGRAARLPEWPVVQAVPTQRPVVDQTRWSLEDALASVARLLAVPDISEIAQRSHPRASPGQEGPQGGLTGSPSQLLHEPAKVLLSECRSVWLHQGAFGVALEDAAPALLQPQ